MVRSSFFYFSFDSSRYLYSSRIFSPTSWLAFGLTKVEFLSPRLILGSVDWHFDEYGSALRGVGSGPTTNIFKWSLTWRWKMIGKLRESG